MAEQTESTSNKPFAAMAEEINNARLLLAHAARTGVNLDAEVIRSIVQAKNYLEGTEMPSNPVETEIKFWQAMEMLAKSVGPVTVASLQASHDTREDCCLFGLIRKFILRSPKKISLAKQSVRRFRFYALFTLFLLLFVQIYWVVGSSVTKDVDAILLEKEKDVELRRKIELDLDALAAKKDSGASSAEELDEMMRAKREEINRIEARMAEYEETTELNYEILERWNVNWRRPAEIVGSLVGGVRQETTPASSALDETYKRLLKSLATAKFALHALQIYMLPILYGLLGSITYVLRTLAAQIKALTYTPEADIGFRLRMILGALSGLVIVWFLKEGSQENPLPFANLSQFAIAFIAGYSVELLFTAMDRFITAFSGAAPGKS